MSGEVVAPEVLCAKHPAISASRDGRFLFVDSTQLGKDQWVILTNGKRAIQLNAKALDKLMAEKP